jgi:hypothetical protein
MANLASLPLSPNFRLKILSLVVSDEWNSIRLPQSTIFKVCSDGNKTKFRMWKTRCLSVANVLDAIILDAIVLDATVLARARRV